MLPVLAFSNQHLDISIYFFKRLLHAQGIYATDKVRSPKVAFDAVPEDRQQADRARDGAGTQARESEG